jgi:hypothetical protein
MKNKDTISEKENNKYQKLVQEKKSTNKEL